MSHAGQVPRGPCSEPKPVFPAQTMFPCVLQPGARELQVASTLFSTRAVSLTQKTLSVPSQNRRKNDPRAPSSFTSGAVSGTAFVAPHLDYQARSGLQTTGVDSGSHTKDRDMGPQNQQPLGTRLRNPAQPDTAPGSQSGDRHRTAGCGDASLPLHLCHPGSLLMPLKVEGWACISNRQVLSARAALPGTGEMEAGSAAALPVTRGRPSQAHLLPHLYKPQLPLTRSEGAASSFGI